MYHATLATPSGSDWPLLVSVFNDETNEPLAELDGDALVEMQLQDRGGSVLLSATTDDGSITIPATGQCQWVFTYVQMRALCPGNTYSFACRMTTDGGTTTLLTGSLAYIDGEFEWQ